MPEPRKNEGGFASGVLLKVAELERATAMLRQTVAPSLLLPLPGLGERVSLSFLCCSCHFGLCSNTLCVLGAIGEHVQGPPHTPNSGKPVG